MASGVDYFLNKTLGEDFMESLSKVELWKPGTKSTVDHEELKTALQIVPRTVMAILIRELAPMSIGDNKKIVLPIAGGAILNVSKHERDVYSGNIEQGGKILTEFKLRALPGIGLVIMSTFELYNMENLLNTPDGHSPDAHDKVQRIIEERLALHDLVGKVVDKKIMERDAIHQLYLKRLSELSNMASEKSLMASEAKANPEILLPKKKGSPVKEFLDSRKKKKNEFSIEMSKSETVHCPDCKKNIFSDGVFSGCICLGDDMQRKVFIKKSEDGIKVRFSHGWDPDNIEMLLEVLRKKRE